MRIRLISYRHNLTQEVLPNLFEVSQPTVSRTIKTIEKTLEKILTPLVPTLEVNGKLLAICLLAGGTAGQYLVSEMMWALRRAQFKHSHPGQTYSKVMVDEYNAQDIILPVFSKPFSKVESDGGGQR